jgi:heme-degrading monooxygenase HmoA
VGGCDPNIVLVKIRSLKGRNMILEVAILDVKPEVGKEFEISFREASAIISSMPGYISHELQKCIETSSRYILLVQWETLEDHTIGFRQSEKYQEWKNLLHHYYDPFPTVEHYQPIIRQSRTGGMA